MSVTCGISAGFTWDCDTRKNSAGGLKTTIWLGNISELSSVSYDGSGYVSSLNFDAYKGLYEFTGAFNANSASSDATRTDGGNVAFPHTLVITVFDVTPCQKTILEDLANADGVFAVVETTKGRFEGYGMDLGMVVESMPRSTGASPSDSTSRVITLSGEQGSLEEVLSAGSYTDTKTMIESYVIAGSGC